MIVQQRVFRDRNIFFHSPTLVAEQSISIVFICWPKRKLSQLILHRIDIYSHEVKKERR